MHTKGPWQASSIGIKNWQSSWYRIVAVWQELDGTNPGNAVDDVRLIAAAPELLAVAKGCLGYLEALPVHFRPYEVWFIPLRKAIEKAEGR